MKRTSSSESAQTKTDSGSQSVMASASSSLSFGVLQAHQLAVVVVAQLALENRAYRPFHRPRLSSRTVRAGDAEKV